MGPFNFATGLDRWYLLLGFIIAVLESIADPIATVLIGKMWEAIELLTRGSLSAEMFLRRGQNYAYGLVGVTCYSALLNSVGYFLWNFVALRIGHSIRLSLFKVLVHRQAMRTERTESLEGETAMHFKDIQDIESACGLVSYEMIAMASGCFIEIGVALYFSWAVTLVCLAGVPVLVLLGCIFSSPVVKAILVTKAITDELSLRISWVLSSLTTVKVLQKERFEGAQMHKGFHEIKKRSLRYWFLLASQQGLCRTVVLMIFMQGFYFGSYMVKDHGLSAGNVVTVFWCCLNASALLQAFMSHLSEWNKAKASAQRLRRTMDVDEEQELFDSIGLVPNPSRKVALKLESLGWQLPNECNMDPFYSHEDTYDSRPATLTYISLPSDRQKLCSSDECSPQAFVSPESTRFANEIEFTDVVFSYPARNELVLSGLSMKAEARQTTFIAGRSGSGKSTIASLLSKQYPWQAGEVTINGYDVHLLSDSYIEKNVYVCEQNTNLFDITIRENIALGSQTPSSVSEAEIKRAVSDACAEFVWELPDKLDTLGIDKLSGGQQQLIAIARARLRDAPIMVYDEVTSALDKDLRSEVISKMLCYRQGKTTLIITHDLSIIPPGHPIFAIEHGHARKYQDVKEIEMALCLNEEVSDDPRGEIRETTDEYEAEDPMTPDLVVSQYELTPNDLSDTNLDSAPANVEHPRKNEFGTIFQSLRFVPNKLMLTLGLMISAVHAAINPVFSFVFSKLIMAIVDPSAEHTTKWALLVLMLAILDGMVTWAKFVLHISAEAWLCTARERLYLLLVDSDTFRLGSKQISYYVKLILSDSDKCAEVISVYIPGLVSILVIGVAGFVCSFAFGWKLTIVGISLLPAFVISNQVYKKLVRHWTRIREMRRTRLIRLLMELTSERGHHTLKVQHLEGIFRAIYLRNEDELHQLTVPLSFQVGGCYGLLKCAPYALESLVLWYGIRLVGIGEYTVQQTMTVFSLLMFTIVTIDQLTSTIGSIGNGFEALERLQNALTGVDEATRQGSGARRGSPLESFSARTFEPQWQEVSFQHVGKVYANGTAILDDFTETFRKGEVVAIMGPSGTGKSGIARLIERLEDPSSGEIVIDGVHDLEKLSLYSVRKNVGLVSQAPQAFYSGTIEEAVLYGSNGCDNGLVSVIEACKLSGAHEFITQLEHGYDTRINAGQLSGGQLQRLGIARVLIRKPKVLILDECTSALDRISTDAVKRMINNFKKRKDVMIILITHQNDFADIADRIITLKKT